MAYLGLAIVIANDYKDTGALKRRNPLPGTHEDSKEYRETFEKYLKFKVNVGLNLSGNGIRRAVDNLILDARQCPFGRKDACVAFVFCGHGEEGVIVGQDGVVVCLSEIFARFTISWENDHLVHLVKLFFIDACRGENEDKGLLTARGGEVRLDKLVPSEGNMLVTYSTLPQFRAYELANNPRGLFSGCLNKELRNDANLDKSWEDIITIVTQRMEEESRSLGDQARFQIPQKVATLRRIVKPLSEAREFKPLPAPRRRLTAPNQWSNPLQAGRAGELSPPLCSAGALAGSVQVQPHQMATAGSMQPALQPPSMAHQPLASGPASQVHWTTPPSAASVLLVDGPTPTPYVSGATPAPLLSGTTPTSHVFGATPLSHVSCAPPRPLRPTSQPLSAHTLSHLTARDAAESAAKQAKQHLKKNFTEEANTGAGALYCCEVEFLHPCGRLCKGRSHFHLSRDAAEEEACRQLLLQNSEFLTSTLAADAAIGSHQRGQPSIEPNTVNASEGGHVGPPLTGDAAQLSVSVMARSVTTPPSYYQEHPQCATVSSHISQSRSPFPAVTNYQGHPQIYQGYPQAGNTPPTNYQGYPQVGTTNYQGYPQSGSADHSEPLSGTTYQPRSDISPGKTPKMQLKEYCDRKRWPIPQYSTEHFGMTFQSTVLVPGLGRVTGSRQASKKAAEHDAAAKAISRLPLSD